MIKNFHHSVSYSKSPRNQVEDYRKNIKIFINAVEKETAALIDNYENKIKQLNNEIVRLKKELDKRNGKIDLSQELSPIKFKSDILSGMRKTGSNFIDDFPIQTFLGLNSKLERTSQKMANIDYKFQMDSTPDKLSKSRFEVERRNKKQKAQDLLQSLESGKTNLEFATSKMFELIGRSKVNNNVQNQQAEKNQETPSKKRKASEKMNTSLSSICQSLDNSFHGRRAQAKSQKKRQQKSQKEEGQRKRQRELQLKRKEQGIKNLLATMRNNIESSPQKPPEVIKGSKLLTTGEKKKVQLPNKGKVMINPVPVDISNRNKFKQQNTTASSPLKNPQSILKNSSGNNFFSKSIQNISAISFYDSGAQQ